MIPYDEFVRLCHSTDSEERGRAAHMAARAFLGFSGPADEHAALYSALVEFLDDPSPRVRGALAYGLLHAADAPRPIMLALLGDVPVIARAVAQYSPVLVDADLRALAAGADSELLFAIANRAVLGLSLVETLLAHGRRDLTLHLLARRDIAVPAAVLESLAAGVAQSDAEIRGELLARTDLGAAARLHLVAGVAAALRAHRFVLGAVPAARLDRLITDAAEAATAAIGEREAGAGRESYAGTLVDSDIVTPRMLLKALATGHVLFFADCIAALTDVSKRKVCWVIDRASRSTLVSLFERAGLGAPMQGLFADFILRARSAGALDDEHVRHFVVSSLCDDLIALHDGQIPAELEESFNYLSQQAILLARQAVRGVVGGFVRGAATKALPASEPIFELQLLSAA